MQYGFVIPTGDATDFIDLAVEIEQSGWDAAFGWEIVYGLDPWVLLGGMAVLTGRIKLGTLLTPPSRRRPWKLASELATLDRLSGGRAILAAGLGALDTGFAQVGEVTDRKARAELMDETLELLPKFWNAQPFRHSGKHYQVDWDVPIAAISPVQQPGVPVWIAALWPNERSMARACRWNGVLPFRKSEQGVWSPVTPDDVRQIRQMAERVKGDGAPFDIVIEGTTPLADEHALEKVRTYADSGATWWIESMWEVPGGLEAVRKRISAGPPRF